MDGSRRKICDSVTKIFRCDAANVHAVYAWIGQTRIPGILGLDFDFKLASQQIVLGLQTSSFSSMFDYAKEFARVFYSQLIVWLPNATVPLSDEQAPRVTFLGYVNDLPQTATAYFRYENGNLKLPGLTNVLESPSSCLNVLNGKKAVYEKMCQLGLLRPCSTLTEGATLVNRFIQACIDNPPDDSNDVGGDIHIAKVVPTGSHWIIAPKF